MKPLWFYIPPLMHLLNWWDVRIRGKTVIRGTIKYAAPGEARTYKGFAPQYETRLDTAPKP
jgi:hypothetical protein